MCITHVTSQNLHIHRQMKSGGCTIVRAFTSANSEQCQEIHSTFYDNATVAPTKRDSETSVCKSCSIQRWMS